MLASAHPIDQFIKKELLFAFIRRAADDCVMINDKLLTPGRCARILVGGGQRLVRQSVSHCEALTKMNRALQFVDHGDRKILHRNPAVAGRVD